MYSIKQNVQAVLASLKAYNINRVVLSPGSRNIPFIESMTQDPYFQCHLVVDERSAAFYALGLIQQQAAPVVICCTSGTALLNYLSAVAEAYYQQLSLIVLSADRPLAWINQMDGQTVQQTSFLHSITHHSVQLPEIANAQDAWYCQRLLHEALLATRYPVAGPVHINVPISEPFFECSASALPSVVAIDYLDAEASFQQQGLFQQWQQSHKIWIILGQQQPDNALMQQLEQLAQQQACVIITEHLANCTNRHFIHNMDLALALQSESSSGLPDLVISLGGHIVSKRLKQQLRRHKPQAHWFVAAQRQFADLFMSITCWIHQAERPFLAKLASVLTLPVPAARQRYYQQWHSLAQWLQQQVNGFCLPFSDLAVVQQLMQQLPHDSALQLSNSSSVRYAQYFQLPASTISVHCNRGTSGIDGCLSTAVGAATQYAGLTILLIGDLSFFYDINVLLTGTLPANLRILLLNNHGGALFRLLPGLESSPALPHIAGSHQRQANFLSAVPDLAYSQCSSELELQQQWPRFLDKNLKCAMVLEVITAAELSTSTIQNMIKTIRENYEQNKQRLAIH